MNKGNETKTNIMKTAMDMASRNGLEGISFGEMATATNMSKSGLFAHYKSKENLQVAILEYARQRFVSEVISPALKKKRGILRIKQLVKNWLNWADKSAPGGCIFVAAAVDFDDKPGPVRDYLRQTQWEKIGFLSKAAALAKETGDFAPDADCDQFAYEFYSLELGYYHFKRMLDDKEAASKQQKAFNMLLKRYSK